jgi:hypothetical protein
VRPESNFWSRLARRIHGGLVLGYWERVEVKLPLGFPDCVVQLEDRVIFVELKSVEHEKDLKHELRAEQAVWIDKWNSHGGEAYVLALIRSQRRMLWYIEGKLIRQGIFTQVPVPRGVYARGFTGTVLGR